MSEKHRGEIYYLIDHHFAFGWGVHIQFKELTAAFLMTLAKKLM